ncbi:abscission/NoCut checkpoint regulator [Drosophila willistoni]|uniref:abscission/NoCut checkpoint regulator n=1 Tax=Drosophila willistoni TaxID=7260 RepID=UPI00017D8DCE|nr:abscission/NoCut checkpoint regulator [Drosophila willistoni]
MSCYGCSRKYGIFCKENGCPNCGYSYCSKCLKRPMPVPRYAGKVMNVCLICYDKLSKLQANADAEKVIDCEALPGELVTNIRLPAPPKSPTELQQQLEAADAIFDNILPSEELAAVLAPTSSSANTAGNPHSITNAEDINENLDSAITKRLQNLKTVEPTGADTDDEIRDRLSNLSGMPHQKNYDKKDLLLSTDQRSDQDKIKDLLEQFMGETQLDQRVSEERSDPISDIERRLRALRDAPIEEGAPTTKASDLNTPSDNEDDENDETVLQNIMKKYVAESRLPATDAPEVAIPTTSNAATSGSITEELPWCNVCNEDAVFRCLGCDGELFCAQCFRECHDDDEEYRDHVKEKYSAPPNFKENHF